MFGRSHRLRSWWSPPPRLVPLVFAIASFVALAARGPAAAQGPLPRRTGAKPSAPEVSTVEQRRREVENLRREDVAAQLALLGVPLVWQEHALAQLLDWRDRIEAAVTLRVQHHVDVDWRTTSLAQLNDMRLRASKATELASQYGVRVDWRQYTWAALESLRRQVARLRPSAAPPFADDALAAPGSVGRRRRLGRRPSDPDAIIEPTFAFGTLPFWSRPVGRRGPPDPDAILIPAFVTTSSQPPR